MSAFRPVLTREVSDWYPVGWAGADAGPLQAQLEGIPIALWKSRAGWRAFEDRCPHRNAPLSAGKIAGGRLVCPYHGWSFDDSGRCAWIPSLGRAGKESWAVKGWPVRLVDGLLFVGPETRSAPEPALAEGGHRVRLERVMEAPLERVAENILDVPHTSVLHGGLFRRHPSHSRKLEVERNEDRVLVRYPKERPKGLVARLFGPGEVTHEDEFRLPACAIVRYARGEESLVIASWLAPETEGRTRMFSVASLHGLKRWAPWLESLVWPIVRRILDQDAWILRRQSEVIQAFGGPRFLHVHDPMGRHIERLRRDRSEGRKTPPSRETMEMRF